MSRDPLRAVHGAPVGAPGAVTLVDAHHHLWDLRRNRYPWLQDHPEPNFFLGDYDALKHDDLPDDYRRDAAGHDVIATVHCEAEWTRDDQVGETAWLSRVHAGHGFPNAIVAHAWFHTPNAEEVLERQAAFPLAGLRVDFDTLVSSVSRMLEDFDAADRHRFFVANAVAFYRLSPALARVGAPVSTPTAP